MELCLQWNMPSLRYQDIEPVDWDETDQEINYVPDLPISNEGKY
jgi:hypothetical protein